ncbi:MAG: hypothetical protein KF760_31910 [Candidatus Eremiobacteraeota bacterium]|nr:hypothetical protein [Candidatus Eremiobacteraeota bacterium]MCW5869443.1 hypothetical protein [Candidatus Eremiobacteraeota bacterium]
MDAARTGTRNLETPTVVRPRTRNEGGAAGQATAGGDRAAAQTLPVGQLRGREPAAAAGPHQVALQEQGGAAQRARGTILRDPAAIVQHEIDSNPRFREQYARLTPAQQAVFQRVARSQVAEGTTLNTAPTQPGLGFAPGQQVSPEQQRQLRGTVARNGLYALLREGKLGESDSRGGSALNNLDRLQRSGRNGVLEGALANLAMPGAANNPQSSAAVSEFQNHLIEKKPAEYLNRLATLVEQGRPAVESKDSNEANRLLAGNLNEADARRQLFHSEIASQPGYASLGREDRVRLQRAYDATIPSGPPPVWPEYKDFRNPTAAEQEAQRNFSLQLQEQTAGRQSRADLTRLLRDDRLNHRDSQGQTLMANLDTLRTQRYATEGGHSLNGQTYYREVLHQVASPGSIHQGDRGTCTVTSIEYLQATREPAEYARIMSGLAGPEGRVAMRDGQILTRDAGIVAPDSSGRSSASRVYQASLMEFANGTGLDYSNEGQGRHLNARGVAQLDGDGKPRGGLYADEIRRIANPLLEGAFVTHNGTMHGGNREAITRQIQEAIGDGQAVQVGMRWSRTPGERDSYHALTVDRIEGDYVYLRNPWGFGESGNSDGSRSPVRQALRSETPSVFGDNSDPGIPRGPAGSLRMKRDEFFANLSEYHVLQEDPSLLEKAWQAINPIPGWRRIANFIF